MVGAGCTKVDINEDNLAYTERNNQMVVSAIIRTGVKIVTTKVATKVNTTTNPKHYGKEKQCVDNYHRHHLL